MTPDPMFMAVAKLCEHLLALVRGRKKASENDFARHVEPMMKMAKEVYEDYRKLFFDLKKRINDGQSSLAITTFLEEGRLKNLATRRLLRANVYELIARGMDSQFQKGIVGLLLGGLSIFEEQQPGNWHLHLNYRFGNHTLLDLIYGISSTDFDNANTRRKFIHQIEKQEEALDRAFNDVSSGFAGYSLQLRKQKVPVSVARLRHFRGESE